MKLATTVVAPILTDMFNCCIQEGTYPDILKIAQIIPIYKKGDKEKCCNYRPISLLSPISKVFEKLIYNQLQNYLYKKRFINCMVTKKDLLAVNMVLEQDIPHLEQRQIYVTK